MRAKNSGRFERASPKSYVNFDLSCVPSVMDTTTVEYFKIPDLCPVCAARLQVEGDFLYCRSKSCPIQLTGTIKVWVKRLGLLNWGDALIESLTNPDSPKVNSVADLYRLSVEDISDHCSGMKVAKKCFDTLQASRIITFELLLGSLNIQNMALSTATDVVQAGYDTPDKILNATEEQLLRVPNVGPVTAKLIYEGVQERRAQITDLCSVLELKTSSGPLSGKSFCITGSTSKPRKTLEKMILDSGGIVKSSVGVGLSFLITNDADSGSSKLKNAQKHGTSIVSEADFYRMIESGV